MTRWSEKINFENHFLTGYVWDVVGSKDNVYDVVMEKNGFSCTCPRYKFYSDCKHVQQIAKRICLS